MKYYTTREVSELLGMPLATIRNLAKVARLSSRRSNRTYLFSFEDMVLLRAAKGLLHSNISERQIYASLRRLRELLPKGQSLASVRIVAEGGDILVQDNTTAWNPVSGQFSFSFTIQEISGIVAPLLREAAGKSKSGDLSSEGWYELALELELISALEEARSAYETSLRKNPNNADAHVNLGRLLQLEGDLAAAAVHYRDALNIIDNHATAAFNLGTVLEEWGENEAAIEAYRQAIDTAPHLADAHLNLAQLYEQLGDRITAMRYLKKYQGLLSDNN